MDALRTLPTKLENRILRRALNLAADPILERAKSNAPVETGLLRESLKKSGVRNKKGRMGISVGTNSGDYKGETFYAAFVEYGHRIGKRNNAQKRRKEFEKKGLSVRDDRAAVPARPFLRPAFDARRDQALEIMKHEIGTGVEKEFARRAKKQAKVQREVARFAKQAARKEARAARQAKRFAKLEAKKLGRDAPRLRRPQR